MFSTKYSDIFQKCVKSNNQNLLLHKRKVYPVANYLSKSTLCTIYHPHRFNKEKSALVKAVYGE